MLLAGPLYLLKTRVFAGDNGILEGDIFCPVFLGKTFPCDGGVMALNGLNGELLWRHWMNDTIFSLMCKQDVNGDGSEDCLAVGNRGVKCCFYS